MTTIIDALELASAMKTVAIDAMIERGEPFLWLGDLTAEGARQEVRLAFTTGQIDRIPVHFRRRGPFIEAMLSIHHGLEYGFRYRGDFGDLLMEAVNVAI